MDSKDSCCIICKRPFLHGDYMEAFLKSPDRPKGIWTQVIIDSEYQSRYHKNNNSKLKCRHVTCPN